MRGRTLIDIGSGPCIYAVASLSSRFDKIILSEYTEDSRKEIEKWLKKDPTAHDWSYVFNLVSDMESKLRPYPASSYMVDECPL